MVRRYLGGPAILSPLASGLCLFLIYQQVFEPHTYSVAILYALVMALLSQALGARRWALYVLLLAALGFQLCYLTHELANGPQDATSSRDEALEGTARALLQGRNAWSGVTPLGAQATTGPASILLALPFVAVSGEVNGLSFLFWAAFFAMLLWFDLERRNDSFSLLTVLFMTGALGFQQTLGWSLDELYYPYLFFGLSYVCLRRGWFVASGALLASTVLFRASYVFTVVAFVGWLVLAGPRTRREFVRLAAGGVAAILLVLTPFVVIGGQEFMTLNAFTVAYGMSGANQWPPTNPIFGGLNFVAANVGPLWLLLVKLALIGGALTAVSRRLRAVDHPFWHIAVAGLLTYTVVWHPDQRGVDYALAVVLPAFMAIACAPRGNLA